MNEKKQIPSQEITAAELVNKLKNDPEFLQRQRKKDRHFEALKLKFEAAEKPLVQALKDVGVSVNSVWDLVNRKQTDAKAIPILLDHLRHPYPYRVREGIARALTEKVAGKSVFRALVDEYSKVPESADAAQHGFKWALGNAIAVVAKKDDFDERMLLSREPLLRSPERNVYFPRSAGPCGEHGSLSGVRRRSGQLLRSKRSDRQQLPEQRK
jgi:hypothetical protein